MDKITKMKQEKQYEAYVKEKTPVHNVYLNMIKAFITGGTICLIGQFIFHFFQSLHMEKDICSAWTSLLLILLSVILTGIDVRS